MAKIVLELLHGIFYPVNPYGICRGHKKVLQNKEV